VACIRADASPNEVLPHQLTLDPSYCQVFVQLYECGSSHCRVHAGHILDGVDCRP
jgi:hypothetical protein